MLTQYLRIFAMRNSSIVTQRAFLIVGLIIATTLVCTPAWAGQDRATSTMSTGALSLSTGGGLEIPLSESFSLDFNLSSVATGQSSNGERELGTPPIPISKPPGSDLHYTRLGVGFSFRF